MVLTATREQVLAMGLILGADRERHGAMIRNCENAFTAGRNEWPRTLGRHTVSPPTGFINTPRVPRTEVEPKASLLQLHVVVIKDVVMGIKDAVVRC